MAKKLENIDMSVDQSITFNGVLDAIKLAINESSIADKSTLINDVLNFMISHGMANDEVINNKYVIAYLANILNVIARHGKKVFTLKTDVDKGKNKENLTNWLSNFIDSNIDDNGKVGISNENGTLVRIFPATQLSDWFFKGAPMTLDDGGYRLGPPEVNILNNAFFIGELNLSSSVDTFFDYNFLPTNAIDAAKDYDLNSTLSNGFISWTDNILKKLMENLCMSKVNSSKVSINSYGFDADDLSAALSSVCSSSSSSSSCEFIAYMKLD